MTRSEWLADLRTAFADLDAVARDMLRPPRERELGPAYHRSLYDDAAEKMTALLENGPDSATRH
jgi:hypothetical protein